MAAPTPSPTPELLRRMCLVLVRTQGPVNLGMAARLCGNLSITDLRLVSPLTEIDCEDARKFATHNRDFLLRAPVFPTLDAAVADCGLVVGTSARIRDANLGEPILPQALPPLIAARPAAKWALVFGNEADGLSEDELFRCQALVRLETYGENYSYNLSHAIAIMGYVLATSAGSPPSDAPESAPREMIERLMDYWLRTLDRFRYFRRTDRPRFEPQFRRLVNRQHWSTHDAQMLWGMLGQMNYHAFGGRDPEIAPDGTAQPREDDAPR